MLRGVSIRLRTPRVRLKLTFFILTTTMAVCLLIITFYGSPIDFERQVSSVPGKPAVRNYFLSQDSYDALEFVVNTTGCKILDLDPWDASILEHIVKMSPNEKCNIPSARWTYVNGSSVVINQTAMQESGYNYNNLYCCYRIIRRVEQSLNDYDKNADATVKYSEECIPLELVTKPKGEMIQVICKISYLVEQFLSSTVYKSFHILALPNERFQKVVLRWKELEEDEAEERKQSSSQTQQQPSNTSQGKSNSDKPPSVVIIGMDSTSRLNFRRSMFKTKEILDGMGAHEMMGYTKVGENTYPNTIPFLTGYNEYEMEDLCRFTRDTNLDGCPFIWKSFKDAYYTTAEIEDSPRLTSFNYMKTGFVLQPTDFYDRPIMLAAHQALPGYPYSIDCVGSKTVDQFLLDYMRDLLQLVNSKRIPIFLMSWLTQLGHDGMNNLQMADGHYASFLRSLLDGGLLDNSIFIFMSDHGYRFGPTRYTLSGWYEDRLPNMWIRLPPSIIKNYPHWELALTHNQRQLSSPFDLYHTFVDILQTFSHMPDMQESPMRNGSTLARRYGQSFFTQIPENRTCCDAGIPDYYCACQYPIKMSSDNPALLLAAQAAVTKINSLLPPQCVRLKLGKIEGAAQLSSSGEETSRKVPLKYVIDFMTTPGDFLFEATVHHRKGVGNDSFEVSGTVQRLTKITTDLGCIRQDSIIELYCYCDSIPSATSK